MDHRLHYGRRRLRLADARTLSILAVRFGAGHVLRRRVLRFGSGCVSRTGSGCLLRTGKPGGCNLRQIIDCALDWHEDIYIVLDDCGSLGRSWRETLGEDAFGLVHDAYEIGMINCKLFSQSMRNQSEGLLGAH